MLRIGKLSAASGATRDALRYYEKLGLLPRSPRSSGGFRQYDRGSVDRIRFVRQAQQHGLTLREIRDLIGHQSDANRARCPDVRDPLARKVHQTEGGRRGLNAFCRTRRDYQPCATAPWPLLGSGVSGGREPRTKAHAMTLAKWSDVTAVMSAATEAIEPVP